MPHLSKRLASRITAKLKKTLWAMGEETRLNQCRKAVAEAFDFDGEHAMHSALPCEARWNGEWCANHLADNMFVSGPAAARLAVETVETSLGHILFARVGPADRIPLD